MRTDSYIFADRTEAGLMLGERLLYLAPEKPIVVGLARGGVVVASQIAMLLDAPLFAGVARKVGAPQQPELGVGAVAPGGIVVTDVELLERLRISPQEMERAINRESKEMERREQLYESVSAPIEVEGRTVIVVDDGLATGVTAMAAVQSIQAQRPKRIIAAFPVCSRQGIELLEGVADEVVYFEATRDLVAVGQWYRNFEQIDDDEVVEILKAYTMRDRHPEDLVEPGGDGQTEAVIDVGGAKLTGDLTILGPTQGIVLFAHGSGSSRLSPRNRYVSGVLNLRGFATLLVDLLTPDEEREDRYSGHLRFDIGLLADRLSGITNWIEQDPRTRSLPIGYFGASTGAAAALVASVGAPRSVKAIVSRGGRPDLAAKVLKGVSAPTLLIVGGEDLEVIPLNERALTDLGTRTKRLEIIKGAQHLFEEPGALEQVAELSASWFERYLH